MRYTVNKAHRERARILPPREYDSLRFPVNRNRIFEETFLLAIDLNYIPGSPQHVGRDFSVLLPDAAKPVSLAVSKS